MEPIKRPSKETTLATLKIFWQHAWKYPKDLVLSLIFIPLNVLLISTAVPWLISRVLNVLADPHATSSLTPLVIWIAISALLGIILNYFGYGYHFKHTTKTCASLGRQCFKTLSLRGETFYANMFTGALTKYAIDYPNAFATLESTTIVNIMPFFLRALSGIVIVYFGGAPWLAGLLLLFSAATTVAVYIGRKKRGTIRNIRRNAWTAINIHLADMLTNNQTMRTFAQWKLEQAENKRLIARWSDLMLKDFAIVNKLANQLYQISLGIQVVFVIVMIHFVHTHAVSIGVAVFCVTYLVRFATELFGVGNMLYQIENAFTDAEPMTKIFAQKLEVVDRPGAQSLQVTKGNIEFKNVAFAYNDSKDTSVLPDLSLTIKAGEKIGLVGPSGGGKTTITKLLLRLLDIQEGKILIDSQNIADVTQESLRKHIAYVPQEPILFHRTLAENLSYSDPSINKEAIIKAAKQAHAQEFIEQLPNQYETLVGERGVKLSGGQRQRVAIARAILKNAPILLLDEATSALDSESEQLIQDALDKLMNGRTAIVIAHRLSTIQKMDRIIVLDKGVIAEEGTHKELLKNKGLYAKLWAHQSGGFLED